MAKFQTIQVITKGEKCLAHAKKSLYDGKFNMVRAIITENGITFTPKVSGISIFESSQDYMLIDAFIKNLKAYGEYYTVVKLSLMPGDTKINAYNVSKEEMHGDSHLIVELCS